MSQPSSTVVETTVDILKFKPLFQSTETGGEFPQVEEVMNVFNNGNENRGVLPTDHLTPPAPDAYAFFERVSKFMTAELKKSIKGDQ